MFGLFQEHGPCFISNDSSTFRHNAYSWTTNANIMYIDQPAGVGFSVTMPARIRTSAEASVDIWAFLQIWLKDPRFKKFVGRDTGIWTESYGGHYGPAFAKYVPHKTAPFNPRLIAASFHKVFLGTECSYRLERDRGYFG
jgi:carboxypeptidase C (cathepsin A)